MSPLLFTVTVCACIYGVLGAVRHNELEGEQPEQYDIDNGQCIPIKCDLGVPPEQCTRLCALRNYIPICKPPGDFCLCQRVVGDKVELVSPDEVETQPMEPPQEVNHFTVLAILMPLKNFFSVDQTQDGSVAPEPSPEPFGYDTIEVNVHEGRLFWDFRYILTGLFLLMVALVVYELIMCRMQTYVRADEEPKLKIVNV